MQELAESMAEAVEVLGLSRYNLIGTSFGGKLALWLAVQHPDRLEALVLESPAAIRPEGHARPSVPPDEVAPWCTPIPSVTLPVAWTRRCRRSRKRSSLACAAQSRPELESRFAALKVPTLVLFGTQDRIIPPEMGRVYREKLPNCHFMLVYDAAHAIGADRPEAFTSLVSDFLERREQFLVSRASSLVHP